MLANYKFGFVALSVFTQNALAYPLARRASSAIGNFGSCSIPEIEFGVGFDGRKETSFQPVDKKSFNHGSADNIDIITKFMCDTLTNTCGADQTAKNTCAQAEAAADAAPPKTGAQADAFNKVFGINTDFAAIAEVNDQGQVVAGTGSAASASSSSSSAAASTANNAASGSASGAASGAASSAASSGIGNFGSCSVPEIEFGVGFDGRKETSFQPVDQKSFNHGSADNIDIITQFICNTLTNSCGADQTAKNTCAKAQAAADTATAKTGAQADAFNQVFGITTDFAAIAEVNDQGQVVAGTGSAASASSSSSSAAASPASNAASGSASSAASGAASGAASSAASSGIGNFGSCSVPEIEFGVGFDGRKETSFQPVDEKSFNHGSADNIDIITQFICDQLTNSCGADQTAKNTCAKAQAAADTATAKTGAQADAFNQVFGITTDFAAVAEVNDQGQVVAGTGSAASASSSSSSAAASPASNAAAGAAAGSASGAASGAASSGIGNFGSCSVPEIEFGVGFDGRKETSFQPVDQKSFNHGSADNIGVITDFICNALTNTCDADQTAKNTCAQAQAAANAATAKTGAQADAFNKVFGINTDFANVQPVDDTGKVVS